MTTTTSVRFPYGTYRVDEDCIERYDDDYEHADEYPLPTELPLHHPLLQALEGTTPVQDAPAPWWPDCVAQISPAFLRPLLLDATAQEFRDGCLAQQRWKQFKSSLSEEDALLLPKSPKLAPLAEQTTWSPWFSDRGPVETPADLDLVISTQPLHFLYMSNGAGWRSCQHHRNGGDNECLPGNFYDAGVAVAMLLPRGADVWEPGCVLARTTLRIFNRGESALLAIGRTYHNNMTLVLLLLSQLADMFDARQIPWGFISGMNSGAACWEGALGPTLQKRPRESVRLRATPYWLPYSWNRPYVEGGYHQWETTTDERQALAAEIDCLR